MAPSRSSTRFSGQLANSSCASTACSTVASTSAIHHLDAAPLKAAVEAEGQIGASNADRAADSAARAIVFLNDFAVHDDQSRLKSACNPHGQTTLWPRQSENARR